MKKALEVQKFDHNNEPGFFNPGSKPLYRAFIVDMTPGNVLILEIAESEDLCLAIDTVLGLHPDTSWAKCGSVCEQSDAISVSEAARAMAGVW